MNSRTKLLSGAMLMMLVAVLGDQAYREYIEKPAEKRERELSRVRKQISTAEDAILASVEAADQLEVLERFSLPYDEELARARYQDWLLSLVEEVDLKQPSVDSGAAVPVTLKAGGSRKSKEIYQRYSFSVRGRGSLQQITDLLYRFYRGGHLHKIRTLTLNPLGGGTQLDLNMSVEALGLTRCEREGELSEEASGRLANRQLEDYGAIVQRNLFFRRGDGTLQKVVLTAITFDRQGRPGAWFSVGPDKPTQVIHRGDTLSVAAHKIQILDIQPELVLVELDGAAARLVLGKSLHDATAPLAKKN